MSKARGHLQNERLPNRSTGNRYSVEEQRASRKKEVLMKLRIRRRFQSLIDLNITALNIGTFLPWPRVLLFRQPPAKTYLNARQSNSPAFFMVSVGDKWDLFYLLSTHVRQAFSTRRHNERREKNTDSAEVVPVCEQNSC